jgi:hypothetical protein
MSINDAITSIGTLVSIAAVVVGALYFIIIKNPGKPSTRVLIIISAITTVIIVGIIGTAVFISASTTITINGKKTFSIPGFPAATEFPTSTPSPTPTPKVIPKNLNIVCLNCSSDYAYSLKLNTIEIDYSNQQTITKFTIIDTGVSNCNVQFDKLEFQDESGTIFAAQNVKQPLGSIATGNPLIVNSVFNLSPQPNIHYLLSITLDCVTGFLNPLNYKTQDFVFD